MKYSEKKQREVAYLSQFLEKDLGYTIKDVENIQEENQKKAVGASA